MSKKDKKPYHAIYIIKTQEAKIMLDKAEYDKTRVKGCVFKSFKTEAEAQQFLDKVVAERKEIDTTKSKREAHKQNNAKPKKNKYYAVYLVEEAKELILNDWESAKKVIDNNKFNCVFKSFKELDEALEYFNNLTSIYIDKFIKMQKKSEK